MADLDLKYSIKAYEDILLAAGEDIQREGLLDTPVRAAKAWMELTSGLREERPKMTTFSNQSLYGDLIVVKDIPFYSLCEHHLLPFFGKAHIGVVPDKDILGLSKFARLVDWAARRPAVQEGLTDFIADQIVEVLAPTSVIVTMVGQHMCMEMRGVKAHGSNTITTAVRGYLRKEEREDFFQKIKI